MPNPSLEEIYGDFDPEESYEGEETAGLLGALLKGAVKTAKPAKPKPAINPALKWFETDPLSASMAAAKESYIARMAKQGVPPEKAEQMFELLSKQEKLAEWR